MWVRIDEILQDALNSAQEKYANGFDVMKHLAENTTKVFRSKTETEKAAEVLQILTDQIAVEHRDISESHVRVMEQMNEGGAPDIEHMAFESLGAAFGKVMSIMTAQKEFKVRSRNSTLMAHLCDVYLNTGDHYHTAGITDVRKQQEKWLPGIQGVSKIVRTGIEIGLIYGWNYLANRSTGGRVVLLVVLHFFERHDVSGRQFGAGGVGVAELGTGKRNSRPVSRVFLAVSSGTSAGAFTAGAGPMGRCVPETHSDVGWEHELRCGGRNVGCSVSSVLR